MSIANSVFILGYGVLGGTCVSTTILFAATLIPASSFRGRAGKARLLLLRMTLVGLLGMLTLAFSLTGIMVGKITIEDPLAIPAIVLCLVFFSVSLGFLLKVGLPFENLHD